MEPPTDDSAQSVRVEQYGIYLDQTMRLTEQRQGANQFFMTLNSAIMAAYGFVWSFEALAKSWLLPMILLTVGAGGILMCLHWRERIATYKQLLNFRHAELRRGEVIFDWRPYQNEFDVLYAHAVKKPFLSFSDMEARLPVYFGVVHVVFFAGIAATTYLRLAGVDVGLGGWFDLPGKDPWSLVDALFKQ